MTPIALPRKVFASITLVSLCISGCGWRGLNSLPLPGTQGGAGSFQVQAQLPDVTT
ncbi:MAG: phospholipid/cholesterol/gamma-HCH transport system substrate-binding protein, partial [Mycobacterium sp.]|nr:phospholipid/cholesterol/gamma-HCH transport system substrate-binding protein [Mycobacterium sp.]